MIEFPDDLTIVVTRRFNAPIQLVFDVMTKPEYLRKTLAPFDEAVTECSIDLRAGGNYRYAFVTPDGIECAFQGTYLEVVPPAKSVATWLFEGWPDAPAVESLDLREANGATLFAWTLTFRDIAGRSRMSRTDGIEANLDKVDELLKTLVEPSP